VISSSSSREWRWANTGQLVAIGVPYRHGRHYATNIKDFAPLLRHWRRLHELGFVHGDVRGFNMAMINENEGFLIDLDNGGHVNGTIGNPPRYYPDGYNFGLADGARPKRPDRSPITMKDDLEAMANFMFGLYKSVKGSSGVKLDDQDDLEECVSTLEVGSVEAALRVHDSLLQFVDGAEWSVRPATVHLRDALEHFGYDLKKPPGQVVKGRVGTDPATGSPSKLQKG
jgi:hypothetical protein